MIKNYLELSKEEKGLVCKFINKKEDLDKMFKLKIYNYGEGVLFYFKDNIVFGKVCVVLKEARGIGTAYIHNIDILESSLEKDYILNELINKGREIAVNNGAKEILIGVRKESLLELLDKLGIKTDYEAIVMTLENRLVEGDILDKVALNEENKKQYLRIYNESFNDMPHGTSLDNEELEEYIKKSNDENYFSMVAINGQNIGFFNCEIENEEGMFDIGLCKKYRGFGYGKLLLETAIEFLNNKKVKKVSLIVIEKNKVAYEMYKKRGFKKESVLSKWIIDKKLY